MRKIIFLLISLLFGSLFSSCNTTKRAEKRIYKITEQHPELVKPDTVKIDTVLTVVPVADSVIFAFEDISENEVDTIFTNGGCFSITTLPSRRIKVVYTPDTVNVNFRKEIVTEKIHIEQPRELWRDMLLCAVLLYVAALLIKTLIERLLK